MDFLQPTTWADAIAAKAEHPDAGPIAGGTDLVVGLNFGAAPPAALIDLTAIPELAQWSYVDSADGAPGAVRLGAGVSYAQIVAELAGDLPALAEASRTVGSPQIRNRATV